MSVTSSLNSRENRRNGIAQEVEFRLREIVEEALRFNRKSKASPLTVRSVEQALFLKTGEHVFGIRSEDTLQYERSQSRPDGFFTCDPLVPVRRVIAQPLPQPPAEVAFMSHWLAIDGVQPRIMENTPVTENIKAVGALAAASGAPAAPPVPLAGKRPHPGASLSLSGAASLRAQGTKAAPSRGPTAAMDSGLVLPLTHDLPGEAQLYVDRLGKALEAFAEGVAVGAAVSRQFEGAEADIDAYASSMARDAGLQQMLPTLTALLAEKYKEHMRSVPVCLALLRLLASLVDNPALQLDRYLHTVIAVVQGILCNRSLGVLRVPLADKARGQGGGDEDGFVLGAEEGPDKGQGRGQRTRDLSCLEHVVARERAALLLQTVLAKYGDTTPSLRPRVLKAIADQVCLASTPVSTLTGAITGIRVCGGEPAVRAVLLDPLLTQRLARELSDPSVVERPFEYHCLLYCLHALSQAVQALPEMRARQAGPPTPLAQQAGKRPIPGRKRGVQQPFLDFNRTAGKANGSGKKKKGKGKQQQEQLSSAHPTDHAMAKRGKQTRPSPVAHFFAIDDDDDDNVRQEPSLQLHYEGKMEPCSNKGAFRTLSGVQSLPFKMDAESPEARRLLALQRVTELALEARQIMSAAEESDDLNL